MRPSTVIFGIGTVLALAAYHTDLFSFMRCPEDDPSVWYNRLLHAGVLCWLFSFWRTINFDKRKALNCMVWVVMFWQVTNVQNEWWGDPYSRNLPEYVLALIGLISGIWIYLKRDTPLWVRKWV